MSGPTFILNSAHRPSVRSQTSSHQQTESVILMLKKLSFLVDPTRNCFPMDMAKNSVVGKLHAKRATKHIESSNSGCGA